MKNAIILHGTGNDPQKNWFQWLKKELEQIGYTVWTPLLPKNDTPDIKRYNEFIFSQDEFSINEETILIGHSSGAVAILGILQNLPKNVTINSAYLVGVFKEAAGKKEFEGLFSEPFDFEKITSHVHKMVYIHSDNDPYCPLEHAEYLSNRTGGELVIIPGQQHFSISTAGEKYNEFPELLELIKKNT
jgi:hypothetical protein